MSMFRIALAALAIGISSPLASAQQIGRLFHSAGERAALNSLRKATLQQQKPVAAKASRDPQTTKLDGYVVRSDGKSTLWINGSAVSGTR